MNKTQDEFLDHFARLGVFSKVQSLVETESEVDGVKQATINVTTNNSDETTATTGAPGQQAQTGKQISSNFFYHFFDLFIFK